MAALSTFRQMLQGIDADARPANDMAKRTPMEMTLDDLESHLETARHRVKRAQNELEARLAEFHDAERAFVERINPQLTHHVIVAKEQEEEAGE